MAPSKQAVLLIVSLICVVDAARVASKTFTALASDKGAELAVNLQFGAAASTSNTYNDIVRLSEWQKKELANPKSDEECNSAVPGSVARNCSWGCSSGVYCKCPVGLFLEDACSQQVALPKGLDIRRKFSSQDAAGCSCTPPPTPDPRYKGPFPDDMTKQPNFQMDRVWVCDIKGSKANGVFLLMATISESGDVSDMGSKEGDTVVLADDMYDINKFTPDYEPDGSLDFKIEFGQRSTRGSCCVKGWFVDFKGLKYTGKGRWKGSVTENTSGYTAPRDVELISYATLSPDEKKRYPDFVVPRHYVTVP